MKPEQFNKLKEGMKIKNYKQLCELIEEETKSGKSKKAQLKEIERHIKLEKQGHAFTIKEVYASPQPKQNHKYKQFDNFLIPEIQWKSKGVYIIQLENKVYIGSTIAGFRRRFYSHIGKRNSIPAVLEILKQGATFDILHLMTDEDEPTIRKIEQEYIDLYKLNPEYIVLNTKETHSYTEPKPKKPKQIYIKVSESEYNKAIQALKQYGVKFEIKAKKKRRKKKK